MRLVLSDPCRLQSSLQHSRLHERDVRAEDAIHNAERRLDHPAVQLEVIVDVHDADGIAVASLMGKSVP
jgi:hypothetical protein